MSDVLVLPSMYVTPVFARTVLKVKCFKEEMDPLSAGVTPGRGSRGDFSLSFGSVSVETIQETSDILIFADING